MDVAARERIQVERQGRDERLALAGEHLGDGPLVERDAADELHVEVPHPHHTLRRLATVRERFRQDAVERFTAFLHALLQLARLLHQLRIGERLELWFELRDARCALDEILDAAPLAEREGPLPPGACVGHACNLSHAGVRQSALASIAPRTKNRPATCAERQGDGAIP